MILKTYSHHTPFKKLTSSENRRFDALVYIILVAIVLGVSIIGSL